MTGALALRTAPPADPRHVNLAEHHAAWSSPTGKARAAIALERWNAPALVSLVWAFLHSRSARTSQHTAVSYGVGVRRFVAWAAARREDLIRPARTMGTAYRADLEQHYGPASAGTRLVAARALYAALDWIGLVDDGRSPFRHVKAPRDHRPQESIRPEFPPATVHRMWAAAQDDLDRTVLCLAAGSGLRAGEMLALRWEDVNLTERTAAVLGKGRKPATVYLTDECVEVLQRQPIRTGRVLPVSASTIRYRTARMAAAAGDLPTHRGRRPRRQDGTIHDAGPHRLRHFFCSSVAEAFDLGVAQAAARHSSPATTSRYVKRRGSRVEAFAREHRLAG